MKVYKSFVSIILVFCLLLIPTSATVEVNAQASNLSVHFIDVGQGDATYIKTPSGQNILIDAGNKGKGDLVVAYLKKQKVKTIDVLISTHPDADHVGGLDEVVRAFHVKNVYAPRVSHTTQAYKDFLMAVKQKNLKIKTAKAGVELPLKDVKASFIAPVKTYSKSDLNNWSAVLKVTYKKNSFLFTGDAEERAEKDMIAANKLSKVDVLKVAHHGAKEATTPGFLTKTKPKYAIISVGSNNRYKHPTRETLSRLTKSGSKVYRTDKSGTIVVTSNGSKITIK